MKVFSRICLVLLLTSCATTKPPTVQQKNFQLAAEIIKLIKPTPSKYVLLRGPSNQENSVIASAVKHDLAKSYNIYESIEAVPSEDKVVDPNQPLHASLLNGFSFFYGIWPQQDDCVRISHASDTEIQPRHWMVTTLCWRGEHWLVEERGPMVVF